MQLASVLDFVGTKNTKCLSHDTSLHTCHEVKRGTELSFGSDTGYLIRTSAYQMYNVMAFYYVKDIRKTAVIWVIIS